MIRFLVRHNLIAGAFCWLSALFMFFPIFWMGLTAFKTELDAISVPPLLFFSPTLENFEIVQERSNYLHYAMNSIVISAGATLLALLIAVPAAFTFAFDKKPYYKDLILWMLSTKMLPAVGVLVPIYIIFKEAGLLDTRVALIIIYTLINLPIAVWMMFSYFKEVPFQIVEAARIDGVGLFDEIRYIVLPLARSGIFSTALLLLILSWNEAFWSINLTAANSGSLVAMIAGYSSPEGLFWSKLSAASLLAVAPIVVLGWFSQKQLVQGLTFGAVK